MAKTLIDDSAEQDSSPVRIVEIHHYQGRDSGEVHVVYRADSGWYFFKKHIDSGAALQAHNGIPELELTAGEGLRLLRRQQVVRDPASDRPVSLKTLFRRNRSV